MIAENIADGAAHQVSAVGAAGFPHLIQAAVDVIGVVTGSAEQGIATGATDQGIVAGLAIQQVIAGIALQAVIAGQCQDPVVAAAAVIHIGCFREGERRYRACRRTGEGFCRAITIGVAKPHADGLADHAAGQQQVAVGGSFDGGAVGQPLEGQQFVAAVGIVEVRQRLQGVAQHGFARDIDPAYRCIVDVGHRCTFRTGDAFWRAKAINVADRHAQAAADQFLTKLQGAARCTFQCCAIEQPLILQCAESVGILQACHGFEDLPLCDFPRNVERAGRRVVEVGHGGSGSAGDAFGCAHGVDVAGCGADASADQRLFQHQAAGSGSLDGDAIGQPLVMYLAHAIRVVQFGAEAQGLALHGVAVQVETALWRIVDRLHVQREGGGGRLQGSVADGKGQAGQCVAKVIERRQPAQLTAVELCAGDELPGFDGHLAQQQLTIGWQADDLQAGHWLAVAVAEKEVAGVQGQCLIFRCGQAAVTGDRRLVEQGIQQQVDGVHAQLRTITEGHFQRAAAVEEVVQDQQVAAAGEADQQVVVDALQLHGAGQQAGAELQDFGIPGAVQVIFAETDGKAVAVGTAAADQGVIACAADQGVAARSGIEVVIALQGIDQVALCAPGQAVVIGRAHQQDGLAGEGVAIPARAVGKHQLGGGEAAIAEVAGQQQAVIFVEYQLQAAIFEVVQLQVLRGQAVAQQDQVVVVVILAAQGVVAITGVEYIEVVPAVSVEPVIAGATGQQVIPGAAIDVVITSPAVQAVIPGIAADGIAGTGASDALR